jgi:hypothetical protein
MKSPGAISNSRRLARRAKRRDALSMKSPGAISNSPRLARQGEAQGRAEYEIAGSDFNSPDHYRCKDHCSVTRPQRVDRHLIVPINARHIT